MTISCNNANRLIDKYKYEPSKILGALNQFLVSHIDALDKKVRITIYRIAEFLLSHPDTPTEARPARGGAGGSSSPEMNIHHSVFNNLPAVLTLETVTALICKVATESANYGDSKKLKIFILNVCNPNYSGKTLSFPMPSKESKDNHIPIALRSLGKQLLFLKSVIESDPENKPIAFPKTSREFFQEVGNGIRLLDCKQVLGTGSFGTVSKYSVGLIELAVKKPFELGSTTAFLDIARLNAKFAEHPGINPSICHELSLQSAFMEKADGSLKRIHLKGDELVDCALQLARSVGFMHSQGYIHRDLKPANILVKTLEDKTKCYQLADFDTVCKSGSQAKRLGTPYFISPEIFYKRNFQNKNSDMFSLGMILYFLATGHRKITEIATKAELYAMYDSNFISRFVTEIEDLEIRNLISALVQPNPEERMTADQLIAALTQIQEDRCGSWELDNCETAPILEMDERPLSEEFEDRFKISTKAPEYSAAERLEFGGTDE